MVDLRAKTELHRPRLIKFGRLSNLDSVDRKSSELDFRAVEADQRQPRHFILGRVMQGIAKEDDDEEVKEPMNGKRPRHN